MISTQEGYYGLEAAYPYIVENDVATNSAEWGVQVEVHEHIIEAVVAINENDLKSELDRATSPQFKDLKLPAFGVPVRPLSERAGR